MARALEYYYHLIKLELAVVSIVVLRRTDRGAAGYGCGCGPGGAMGCPAGLRDLLQWGPVETTCSIGILFLLRDLLRWELALVQFPTAGRVFNGFALVERLAPVEACSGAISDSRSFFQ